MDYRYNISEFSPRMWGKEYMSILENYQLFYEQIPVRQRKIATLKKKPGRKPKQVKIPANVLDNLDLRQPATS